MKRLANGFLAAALLALLACSSRDLTKQPVRPHMKTEWNHIDSLAEQGLYQSALEATLQQMAGAKIANDLRSWVKGMVYAAKFHRLLDENGLHKAIAYWEGARLGLNSPFDALSSSLLAELYQRYYESSQWLLRERTYTGFQPGKPMELWAAQDFLDTIGSLYQASLTFSGSDLTAQDMGDLILWETGAEVYAPTLKELLYARAIEFLSQGFQSQPAELPAYLDDEKHFAPSGVFTGLNIPPTGQWHQVLKLYQTLLSGALQRQNLPAQLRFDLLRLQFVHSQSVHVDKERLYENALRELLRITTPDSLQIEVLWTLAQYVFYGKSYPELTAKAESQRKMVNELQSVIQKHPEKTAHLQQLIYQLTQPQFSLLMEQVYVPGQNLLTKITYRNLPEIQFRIMAINEDIKNRLYRLKPEEVVEYLQNIPTLFTWPSRLPATNDYEEHSTEIAIDALPPGQYLLVGQYEASHVQAVTFQVSSLALRHRKKGDQYEYTVLQRETGLPVSGAEIKFYRPQYQPNADRYDRVLVSTLISDTEGRVRFKDRYSGELWLEIKQGGEVWLPEERVYHYPSAPEVVQDQVLTQFFTDRAIYRPGQIIHFKTLTYRFGTELTKVMLHQPLEVQLLDANGEMVHSLQLKTNAFGSASGIFIIPSGGRLAGGWTIQSSLGGSTGIQVEEYKRPTFELVVDTLKEVYRLQDQIKLPGQVKSLSGVKLGGAKVRFQVKRTMRWWLDPWMKMPYYHQPNEVWIARGEVTADAQGRFEISFQAIPDLQVNKVFQPSFIYSVALTATDITGESQSLERQYTLNYTGVNLLAQGPEVVTKWPAKITLAAHNLENQPVETQGRWQLYSLQSPAVPRKARLWPAPDQQALTEVEFNRLFPQYSYREEQGWKSWPKQSVRNGTFATGKDPYIQLFTELRDGPYYLEFLYLSGQDTVKEGFWFWVDVRKNTALVPLNAVFACSWDKDQIPINEKSTYSLRSNWPNIRWHLEWEEKGQTVSQWHWRGNENNLQRGLTAAPHQVLRATAIYQNRFYTLEFRPEVVLPAQKLELEFITFRPELDPGSKETWQVRIKGAPEVELLTAMYDDALEAIYPLTWPQNFRPDVYYPGFVWSGIGFNPAYGQSFGVFNYPTFDYIQPGWIKWNWFDFPFDYYAYPFPRRGGKLGAPPPVMDQKMASRAEVQAAEAIGTGQDDKSLPPPSGLRQNLAETVFFYPHLLPDSNGTFTIPFTMNEALTRWKWNLFAHTPDLKTGYAVQKIITRKLLMVTPNLPRLAYAGDRLLLPVRVDNLTDKAMSIVTTMEVRDPLNASERTTQFTNGPQSQNLDLAAHASKIVYWRVNIPEDQATPVQIRFWAKSTGHTDGEARTLPILSKRVLLTETKSLWTNPGESKSVDLRWLRNPGNKDPYRLTVEYTPNPVWLALQALPYLQDREAVTTDDLIHKWMSLVTGKYIFDRYPQVNAVVGAWTQLDEVKSPLEMNPELKSVLLSETPWVQEAKDQTQLIRQLALFLDQNYVDAQLQELERQISDRLTQEGGLAWYPGGRPSVFITARALETWGWLIEQGVIQREKYGSWIQPGMAFLDREWLARYNQNTPNYIATAEDVLFLYLHTLHPEAEQAETLHKLLDILWTSAAKEWVNFDLYSQITIGLAARIKNPALVQTIQKSLRERALVQPEIGTTWKLNEGPWWYQQPLESQVMAIKLFTQLKAEDVVVDAKKWLIKQKETQHWENGRATMLSILALLPSGEGLTPFPQFGLQVGDFDLSNTSGDAGTGYVKQSWSGKELTADLDQIKIVNTSQQPGWGGAYLQYWTDISQVTSQSSGLKITRVFYKLDDQLMAQKLTEVASLQPGDRIRVVLTLTSDRIMDYVVLKDTRASVWEPLQRVSGARWFNGLGFYQSVTDAATLFYIDHLPKGTFVLEYDVYLNNLGDVHSGYAESQSLYAPKFSARSSGGKLMTMHQQ